MITVGGIASAVAAPFGDAGPITRDGAREAARRELSKAIYHRDDPPWPLRLFNAIVERVQRLFDAVARHSPGGGVGALILLAAVVALVALAWWRLGGVRRTQHRPGAVLGGAPATAADHLHDATEAAADGRWSDAVIARMRAIAQALEDDGTLDPRPGCTADEIAREVAVAQPAAGASMRTAAVTFDAVAYGGRTATREMYDAVVAAAAAVRPARRGLAGVPR